MYYNFYGVKRVSLINTGISSDVGDVSDLPRQPIRPTGELGGTRGDQLLSGIRDPDLLQSITMYYKLHDNNRILH